MPNVLRTEGEAGICAVLKDILNDQKKLNLTVEETIERWVHEKSNCANGSFIAVNYAAIPPELIESELFEHEKGSFTSAMKQQVDKFEQVDHGTLFLDEISDMSLSVQAKVLRALQKSKIIRVGGDKGIRINVRVLATTNRDLKSEIAENRFRENLYHRLGIILIKVPSLNDRTDDIRIVGAKILGQSG